MRLWCWGGGLRVGGGVAKPVYCSWRWRSIARVVVGGGRGWRGVGGGGGGETSIAEDGFGERVL